MLVKMHLIGQISKANGNRACMHALQLTLGNCCQFGFFLWTELQHCVNDRQKCLPLTARLQEDELQQDVLQILQIGNTLLPFLVSFQTTQLTLQQLAN